MGTDTDCVHPTIVPLEGVCGGSTTGETTMELSHIADGRDDCWVPWIRTYSPEKARMGTDTVCVHPTIVPLEGVCGGSTTGDSTMKRSHIADGRDDCWVPWISTYSPERARMGTDTDCMHPTILPVEGVCGGSTSRTPEHANMQFSDIIDERDYCGALMERLHNANERDDCLVPWIRTYSPERAQMGTDTDHVHLQLFPLEKSAEVQLLGMPRWNDHILPTGG
jgi:hypothetical protein